MLFQLPHVETNLPRQSQAAKTLIQAFKDSFAYNDPAQQSGISNPFWRVKPVVYLEVEPTERDNLFGCIEPNAFHPFHKRSQLYWHVIKETDPENFQSMPRIAVIQPGDDEKNGRKTYFLKMRARSIWIVHTVWGLSQRSRD